MPGAAGGRQCGAGGRDVSPIPLPLTLLVAVFSALVALAVSRGMHMGHDHDHAHGMTVHGTHRSARPNDGAT